MLHTTVKHITERIIARSRPERSAYLARLADASTRDANPDRMGCANLAHGLAGGIEARRAERFPLARSLRHRHRTP